MRILFPILLALAPLVPQDEPVAVRLPRETTLSELRHQPVEWLGEEVRFVVQFKGVAEDVPRLVTSFGPRDWQAFEAWPDERYTWDLEVWEDPGRTLFVPVGSPLDDLVLAARPHGRYEITGRVRETLLGEPWIAVTRLDRLEGEVGEGTILHVGRARDLVHEGQYELAVDQFERAKAAPLPPHARAAIEAEILATRDLQAQAKAERGSRPR